MNWTQDHIDDLDEVSSAYGHELLLPPVGGSLNPCLMLCPSACALATARMLSELQDVGFEYNVRSIEEKVLVELIGVE